MAGRAVLIQGLRRAAHVSLSPRSSIVLTYPSLIASTSGVMISQRRSTDGYLRRIRSFEFTCSHGFHMSKKFYSTEANIVQSGKEICSPATIGDNDKEKVKRKKLKGKRAIVRWLKHFRWKKKKEYDRMTSEEKILYKLRMARRKEERLAEALKKIEPQDISEATHDPEVLTPEEHFYLLKMGHKSKNYVPVGRRGIFQGVILNMHLHWKKHQTLKVVVKTFTPEEVREIATDLARLSGGIVLDIVEDNIIIMYRGKNYSQPPTEIMSPRVTLSRKKALDKSKYRDALRAVRRYIPRLQQQLEDLHTPMKTVQEKKAMITSEGLTLAKEENIFNSKNSRKTSQFDSLGKSIEMEVDSDGLDDDSLVDAAPMSESEDLSDIFETDSDRDTEDQQPLYLQELEKLLEEEKEESEDFEEHLRNIAALSQNDNSSKTELKIEDLDEVDKIFLRASSLLKKKKK